MTKIRIIELVKRALRARGWRQNRDGLWSRGESRRRCRLVDAAQQENLFREPVSGPKPEKRPYPKDETLRIRKYRDQLYTPLRNMRVLKGF